MFSYLFRISQSTEKVMDWLGEFISLGTFSFLHISSVMIELFSSAATTMDGQLGENLLYAFPARLGYLVGPSIRDLPTRYKELFGKSWQQYKDLTTMVRFISVLPLITRH